MQVVSDKVLSRTNLAVALLLLSSFAASGALTTLVFAQQTSAPPGGNIQVTVVDPNGVPVGSAVVTIGREGKQLFTGSTPPSGTLTIGPFAPGVYKVTIQRQGFYTASVAQATVTPGQTTTLDVHLQSVREYSEEIEVTAQPSPIDPQQTASTQTIDATAVSEIPYFHTRDYRNVLPYIPGVIAGPNGQIHVAGSSTQEVGDYLDGFEVGQPAGGALGIRINPDALRRIDIQSSRYSAQFGKGSGGLLNLETQDGDNHFRYNATDFIPTLQTTRGIQLNNWTPRAYLSGPIIKDRLWFQVSHQGENDVNIVRQLPRGADTNDVWQTANLARLRLNLTEGNVLTASGLLNLFDSDNSGISPFDPVSVSTLQDSSLYLFALKDQIAIAKDALLEFGAGFHSSVTVVRPEGNLPYIFTPSGRTGNFFEFSRGHSERTQAFSNLYLKPGHWFGTHQFTIGGRIDRVIFHDFVTRNVIQFLDQNNSLLRQTSFLNVPVFSVSTVESSGFIQDRWSGGRWLLEPGLRWDRDSLLMRNLVSPRLAATYLLDKGTETKLSAGAGLYYDRTNLEMISRSLQGDRTDVFFVPAGQPAINSSFIARPQQLFMPRFVNWSVGVERRLPSNIYAHLEYIQRHGTHGWAYEQLPSNSFVLANNRRDRYDAVQITLRKEIFRGYPVLIAYTRSSARTNKFLDFNLENPVFGNQVGGPLAWDAPNQFVSWGWLPVPSFWKVTKLEFAYSVIWRTGFPFITVDQFGRLVSGPDTHRFPDFLTLSPAIERKFGFHGFRWALRLGVDNVTDRRNPTVVDNDVNSPTFLRFFGSNHRTFNGRIRLLGRK